MKICKWIFMALLYHSAVLAQHESEVTENTIQDLMNRSQNVNVMNRFELLNAVSEAIHSGDLVNVTLNYYEDIDISFILLARLLEFSLETKKETGRIPNEGELKTMARIYGATLSTSSRYVFNLDHTDVEFLEGVRQFTEQTRVKTGKLPTVREMENQFFRLAQQGYQFGFAHEYRGNSFITTHINNTIERELIEIKEERGGFLGFLARALDSQHYILVDVSYEALPKQELDTVKMNIRPMIESSEFSTLLDSLAKIILEQEQVICARKLL